MSTPTAPPVRRRQSRATKAVQQTAKDQLQQLLADNIEPTSPAKLTVVPSSSHGRSATGDNGGRPSKRRTAPAAESNPDTPPSTPNPETPKPAGEPTATAEAVPFDRFIGTATKGDETVDCDHAQRNGHITIESASACAKKLARGQGEGWEPGTRTISRYRSLVRSIADPAVTHEDPCTYGHKTDESALHCASQVARKNGLRV